MSKNGDVLPDRSGNASQGKAAPRRAQEVEDVRVPDWSLAHCYCLYALPLFWTLTRLFQLIKSVTALIVPFIDAADEDAAHKSSGHGLAVEGSGPRTALVEMHPPKKLESLLDLSLPGSVVRGSEGGKVQHGGRGKDAVLETVEKVLKYSVNTWDQGFMDKLYASTDAVGLVSELVLGVLNTNVSLSLFTARLTRFRA